MGLKDFVVAIPSYKRAELLRDQTLRVLKGYKIPQNRIYVFVANSDQEKIYSTVLKKDFSNVNIVIGKLGLREIRNFMPKYFKQGQYIFYLDDDMYALMECVNKGNTGNKKDNKLVPLRSLKRLINKGFKLCEKNKCALWGIYPVYNAYFIKTDGEKKYYSTDLKFIIGYGCGTINDHSCDRRNIANKEDYERTLKYYLKYGSVIRFNNVFYSKKKKDYEESDTNNLKDKKDQLFISGTQSRKMFLNLEFPPTWFMRKGISSMIIKALRNNEKVFVD